MNRTLSELFAPPEGFYGQHALLCALSATEPFLDHALEAFTGRSRHWRRNEPGPYFFLMLDRASPRLDPVNVPGVACLEPTSSPLWQHILVMHAKVALLGFGRSRSGPNIERLRLIVFTGNWTEESAKRLMELAWVCEVDITSKANESTGDIVAAGEFLGRLSGLYHLSPWGPKIERLLTVARSLPHDRKVPSRFIHTLSEPYGAGKPRTMLEQFITRVPNGGKPYNFIVCGSGFYEQAKSNDPSQPKLITRLIDELRQAGKMAMSLPRSNATLVINPLRCGQVAKWLSGLNDQQCPAWTIRAAADKDNRVLHAKYVFLANRRGDSLSNGFLYLGSGNLSLQGFDSAPSPGRAGNVEAGVCISAGNVRSAIDEEISDQIPWGDEVQRQQFDTLQPGTGEDEVREPLPSSPIACFRHEGEQTFAIAWLDPRPCGILRGAQEVEMLEVGQANIELPEDQASASYLVVCDESRAYRWHVPVLDSRGELARQPFRARNWDELMGAFNDLVLNEEDVPDESSDDDEENDADDGDPGGPDPGDKSWTSRHFVTRAYNAHSAMQLVETISEKNKFLSGQLQRLPDWIAFLIRIFKEALPESQKKEWQSLRVNFLSVLVRPHFAPDFGQSDNELRQAWEKAVADLAEILGIDSFPKIDEGVE